MLMAALSSKARALIEEAHAEMRPPAGERERLEALLDARLVATPPSPAGQPPALPGPAVGSWRLVTSLAVGAALVGGVAFLALQPKASQPSTQSAVSAPAKTPLPARASADQAPSIAAQAPALPSPDPALRPKLEPQAPVQRSKDSLAREVALLSRATSDLRAGRASSALKLLDEHQRKFSNGMLAVERRAVRAQALCTLKRVSEGRAELSHLAPLSPAAGRAKQLCDAAAGARQ